MDPQIESGRCNTWNRNGLRSGHNSDADIDTVLDFLQDQIAVRKELLRIAALAKSDEPLKEGEAPAAMDEKPVEKDARLKRNE